MWSLPFKKIFSLGFKKRLKVENQLKLYLQLKIVLGFRPWTFVYGLQETYLHLRASNIAYTIKNISFVKI